SASYPNLVMTQWFGLFAPAHTPATVSDKLAAEFKKIYADSELQQKLSSLGLEPTWIPGPELSQRIAVDSKKMARSDGGSKHPPRLTRDVLFHLARGDERDAVRLRDRVLHEADT